MAKRKVNKSQAIRDFADANPDAGPKAIVEGLAKKGIKVAPALVSNVKTAAANKKAGGKKPGRKPGRPAGSTAKAKAGSSDSVSLNALLDGQNFAEKVGGVEEAKKILTTLQKLGK